MKIAKRLLPLLLVLLAILGIGCSRQAKKEVENVVKNELDLLKNLDSGTTQKYISYQELFSDATEDTTRTEDINEVFSLFFRDFDYRILGIRVDNEKNTATASLRLKTLDAQALAEDFAASRLKKEILAAADADSQNTDDDSISLEDRYLILNELLTTVTYDTVERDCTMTLTRSDEKDSSWEIKRTYTLENDLVGGLMTSLSDPDILSPEDTLVVYLDTLKDMDTEEMSGLLGVESILNSSDPEKNAIAAALVAQVHEHFNYEFVEGDTEGYSASIKVKITTFDSDAILKKYQESLDEYLGSAEAVIDGASERYSTSYGILLSAIESNKETRTTDADFHLINDGASWKLDDAGGDLGQAIFGTLSTTPVE